MSFSRIATLATTLAVAVTVAPQVRAGADTEPVIVVPGRPGIPVIINGVDATGAVVEGDWGLARSQIGLTIIRPRPLLQWNPVPGPIWARPAGRFFPATGHAPRLGRLEVIPPADRPKPPPAESFLRGWQTQSAPLPPSDYPASQGPMVGPMRYGGQHGLRPYGAPLPLR